MTNGQLNPLLRHIRALVGEQTAAATDAELLERFAASREEAAFAALVERYGRLVFGVCRRVLRHAQDAEDAFQATFLILAHKAASVRKRDSTASWLYGVAYRVAVKAKADAARRLEHERRTPTMTRREPHAEMLTRELQEVIDEELSHLPERYRAPVVLCCLAGKTQEQAARELGWPVGSMSRWLTRGKELLRKRLARRGFTVSAALLGAALASEAAPAATLTLATIKAAMLAATGLISVRVAALTEGVLRTMVLSKLTLAKCLLLVAGVVVAGAGALALRATAESDKPTPTSPRPPAGPAANPEGEAPEKDTPRTESAFVKAEVTVLTNQQGERRATPLQLTLADPKQIAGLAAFFPEMGQGKTGETPGGWKVGIQIKFHTARGDPLKVSVHWEGEVWSEGHGDWDVKPGLWDHLNAMVESEKRKEFEGTWKVSSIERSGVKAPREEIQDMKWVIRGDRITYWKNDRRIVRQLESIDPTREPKTVRLSWDSRDGDFPSVNSGDTGPGGPPGMTPGGGPPIGPGGDRPGPGGPKMPSGPLGPPRGGPRLPGPPGTGGPLLAWSHPGIYSLEGEELLICEGEEQPTKFSAKEGSGCILYVLKRMTDGKPDGERKQPDGAGAWSKPVNNLSGRLLVTPERLKPAGRLAVTLELKNVSTKPLAVTNQPRLELELLDITNQPHLVVAALDTAWKKLDDHVLDPQWGVIPFGGYLGVRVELHAVGDKVWVPRPGTYVLRTKVIAEKGKGPENQWTGELSLPPVEMVVPREQPTDE
jgi:RNA polymerase sigma factor (sigma-70 family)